VGGEPFVDAIVVGAGVVGLAVARALAAAGDEVLVLEAAERIGSGISARNSEVIHAGLYYPAGSLKATLCVRGKALLYDYCASHGIPHRRLGKLLVAVDDAEHTRLAAIATQAAVNGVDDLAWLDAGQLAELEPELRGRHALLSPSSGIVDSHALMLSLQGEFEDRGGMLALNAPLVGGAVGGTRLRVEVGGAARQRLTCARLINCAGLAAQQVARRLAGDAAVQVPPLHYAKGNYFALPSRAPFRHLVYPVPEAAGLGIHLTLDLAGQARFGPDVEWVETETYAVDPARRPRFEQAIRRYWPGLPEGRLQPDYAGIRPKLCPAGAPPSDFVIQGPAEHGVDGWVNLYGIESPGLTASLAIAEHVVALLH
jgi:L-2-hydroxyglutarate oxidase LhgO